MSKHNKYPPAAATSPRAEAAGPRKPQDAPETRNEEHPASELERTYVIRRDQTGWVLVEANVPREVYERYAHRTHEPDVLPYVVHRVAMDIERRAMGLPQ